MKKIFVIILSLLQVSLFAQQAKVYPKNILSGQDFSYRKTGNQLLQISMPMGGIGAGSISISGIGSLMDFSIFGNPNFSANRIWGSEETGFAVLHIKGNKPVTKVIEGQVHKAQVYLQGVKGQGFITTGVEGLPRFEHCTFTGKYPIANVELSDDNVPLKASVTAYNPFVPLDDKNSSIPCAILEYTLHNKSKEIVDYDFSFNLSNFCGKDYVETGGSYTRSKVIDNGIEFYNTLDSTSVNYGSTTLTIINEKPKIKGTWLRSEWQWDWLSALWQELATGTFKENKGYNSIDTSGKNGGSVFLSGKLFPGQSKTYSVLITWYFPNRNLISSYKKPCDTCNNFLKELHWQPYYTSQWRNAGEVAEYVHKNFSVLRKKTFGFQEALFNTTIPGYVVDAVAANLAIIKSPTIIRQKNGNLWGWEGVTPAMGVGPGTNIHVYNYAQSIANLFPSLERTLREQELFRSLDSNGHVDFRAALPDGPSEWAGLPAADGQLGGIMKVYREYKISGDKMWLSLIYSATKKSLDYCIKTWDPKHKGIVEEPHHNTYDIEFWGPDGMSTSIYLGALASMIELAKANKTYNDTLLYTDLLVKGKKYFENNLYNGRYFKQNIKYEGLNDTSFLAYITKPEHSKGEINVLLRKEGPRYQYGNGCLSDGIIGVWMSELYNVPVSFNHLKIKSHLKEVFKNNFKNDLSMANHACTQRPGYALGHEPGLVLCTWPFNDKPTLPFVYSDEVWTGIEYQVASHMIMEGLVDEGLTIVRGNRYRYDGYVRNPYSEYEFGSFYARAMSSYALLEALSGVKYSADTKNLTIAPKLLVRGKFQSFFSTSGCYGFIRIENRKLTISLIDGVLKLSNVEIIVNGAKYSIKPKNEVVEKKEIITF